MSDARDADGAREKARCANFSASRGWNESDAFWACVSSDSTVGSTI